MAKRTKKSKRTSETRTRRTIARSTRNIRVAAPPTPTGDHPIEFIARGLWVHGSSALLCRNLAKGYLYLPGGHVEFGESAAVALEREFLEETGERVEAGPLLLVTEGVFQTRKRWHHELNLVFAVGRARAGRTESGKPPTIRSREKHIGFEWIDLAAAVDLDIRPLAMKAWLAAGIGVAAGMGRTEWISEIPR